MKYLAYKESDGTFNGWYDDQIHKSIPTPNIQVSDSEYRNHFDTMSHGKWLVVVNGQITFTDPPVPVPTWSDIRNKRNYLLTQSDYTQMPDNELTPEKQIEWKTYRSVLRRLPETYSKPEDVIWPTPPA